MMLITPFLIYTVPSAVQKDRLINHDAWLKIKNERGADLGSSKIEVDPELIARKIREVLGFE